MEIYFFYDITNQTNYYFVPNATTQSQGQALNLPNTNWVLGDLTAANTQLALAQNAYLESTDATIHITCTKSIGKDSDSHTIWTGCDFLTEPENTDVVYEFFTDTNPGFTKATGTVEGQTVYKQKQQDILNWLGLNQVTTLIELPQPPKKPVV
jgi:hypothetical protein